MSFPQKGHFFPTFIHFSPLKPIIHHQDVKLNHLSILINIDANKKYWLC